LHGGVDLVTLLAEKWDAGLFDPDGFFYPSSGQPNPNHAAVVDESGGISSRREVACANGLLLPVLQ
jgi:hypothetical protein